MKKMFHLTGLMLLSVFSPQGQTIEVDHTAFASALTKHDQKQIKTLSASFLSHTALSDKQLSQQIQTTEKILTRIFKTEKNLTPKFIDYLYFEPLETDDKALLNEMNKNLLVSFLANENAKIYIKSTSNVAQFVTALTERGAKDTQIQVIDQPAKAIFMQISEQMKQDFPNQTQFPITENRVSVISPSSIIKPRLALATAVFDKHFVGVEVDDFSYLDQPRENLQHNNDAIRYKTFQAMLEGLE